MVFSAQLSKFRFGMGASMSSAELVKFWTTAGRPGGCVCSGDEFGVAGWNGRIRL
jgi:hypothetical protein